MDASIGSRIKQLRNAKTPPWTQMRLADEVGVSMRTIGTWESTGKVPADKVARLAAALGEDVTEGSGAHPADGGSFEFSYDGWTFSLHAGPDATPEQIGEAAPEIARAVIAHIQALKTHDPAGDSEPRTVR